MGNIMMTDNLAKGPASRKPQAIRLFKQRTGKHSDR